MSVRKSLVLAAALVISLVLAGCGGSDDEEPGPAALPGDAARGGDAATPDVTECRFVPSSDPGDITVGSATVIGRNTTGEVIDGTSIRFSLLDDSGDIVGTAQHASVSYWQPDEELALQVGVFSEVTIESAECEITDVATGSHAELTEFDADAATCELVEPELGGPNVEADISDVSDAPDDEELFATVAIYDGETRVGETFPRFDPGSTQATASTIAVGDDLSCEMLQLRLP